MKGAACIKEKLRAWVMSHGRCEDTINDQTRLIHERIISSIQVLDLILYVERLSNRRVEPSQLTPGAFASIDAIYSTFFQGGVGT